MRLSMRLFDGKDPEELSRIYPTYYWEEIAAAAAEAQIEPLSGPVGNSPREYIQRKSGLAGGC